MATVQHEDIADPKIHEPKGASTASINTVYIMDGAGSGTYQKVSLDQLDTTDLYTDIQSDLTDGTLVVTGNVYVNATLADISTASSVIIPLPSDCTVLSGSVVLGGPITVADATVNFKNSAAASMGSPVTVPYTGSAKGDQYAFTATGNNVITGPSWIEISTDGGSTDAQPLYVTVLVKTTINP